MKIVISGYYGFDNVGDEAILLSMIQAFRLYDPSIEIIVLSNNPKNTKMEFDVEAVNRWNVREIARALKGADGLISGGGSLLQDETGMNSVIYYTGIIKLAEFMKVPVFIYAQGMGPFKRRVCKLLVKQALKKAQITVRDFYSMELLRNIGIHKEMKIVPDPVLGLQFNKSKEGAWLGSLPFSSRFVAVSVREWPSAYKYKQEIAHTLDMLVEKGIKVVFIPMHGEYDYQTSFEVSKLMKQKSMIAPHQMSIEEKISLIAQSDALIGMRLHAIIFSALTYTPFVALSYDPKIDAFTHISRQSVAGHVTKNNWTAETLHDQVTYLLENKEIESKRLQKIITPLQEQAVLTAQQAIQFIKYHHNKAYTDEQP